MIVAFASCIVIAAQGAYVIRTNFITNLRSAPSLDSAVVAKAKAGESLIVIGESDGWLQIAFDKEGAWMASWVDHTVITKDGPFEVTSRFADMTCERGLEWRRDADGVVVYFTDTGCTLTLHPHESVLPAHMREISVEGTKTAVFKVNLALKALKDRAPEWYAYVANAVDKIIGYNLGSNLDVVSGMAYVYPHSATVYISNHAAGVIPKLIGVIVHEACHIYEYRGGLNNLSNTDSEILCHTIELYALEALGFNTGGTEGLIQHFLFQ